MHSVVALCRRKTFLCALCWQEPSSTSATVMAGATLEQLQRRRTTLCILLFVTTILIVVLGFSLEDYYWLLLGLFLYFALLIGLFATTAQIRRLLIEQLAAGRTVPAGRGVLVITTARPGPPRAR